MERGVGFVGGQFSRGFIVISRVWRRSSAKRVHFMAKSIEISIQETVTEQYLRFSHSLWSMNDDLLNAICKLHNNKLAAHQFRSKYFN